MFSRQQQASCGGFAVDKASRFCARSSSSGRTWQDKIGKATFFAPAMPQNKHVLDGHGFSNSRSRILHARASNRHHGSDLLEDTGSYPPSDLIGLYGIRCHVQGNTRSLRCRHWSLGRPRVLPVAACTAHSYIFKAQIDAIQTSANYAGPGAALQRDGWHALSPQQ